MNKKTDPKPIPPSSKLKAYAGLRLLLATRDKTSDQMTAAIDCTADKMPNQLPAA